MTSLNRELEEIATELEGRGLPATALRRLGSVLIRVTATGRDATFAEFHNLAGRFPHVRDADFGALVLEYLADVEAPEDLRPRLYREAVWRATWCATAATGSGEVQARIEHIDRLKAKQAEA